MTTKSQASADPTSSFSFTDDEIAALKELREWVDVTGAPAGIPMSPETRAGRLLLKRLEGFLGDGKEKSGRL